LDSEGVVVDTQYLPTFGDEVSAYGVAVDGQDNVYVLGSWEAPSSFIADFSTQAFGYEYSQ
jgi:hypothetical protein